MNLSCPLCPQPPAFTGDNRKWWVIVDRDHYVHVIIKKRSKITKKSMERVGAKFSCPHLVIKKEHVIFKAPNNKRHHRAAHALKKSMLKAQKERRRALKKLSSGAFG